MKYEIKIKILEKGSPLSAIIAGIKVAKALKLENVIIDFQKGFSLTVKADSNYSDILTIYNLTCKIQEK